MTTRTTTAKRKNSPARPTSAVRPETVKPATTRLAPAKEAGAARAGKKHKKAIRANGNKTGDKAKVIRDSFTMPQNDYAKIGELKQACLKAGMHVKKSELLRAGLHALGKLSVPQLKQAIARMEQIKTGRPKKGGDK